MALTRNFRETIRDRARADSAFRAALLTEATEALITGDAGTARALLRDYINATLGFEALAEATGISSKSLHRMFGAKGNPTLANLAAVLRALENREGLTFAVTAEFSAAVPPSETSTGNRLIGPTGGRRRTEFPTGF